MDKTILFKITSGSSIDFRQVSEIVSVSDIGRARLKKLMDKEKNFYNLCACKSENGIKTECTEEESMERIKSLVFLNNGRIYGVGFLPEVICGNINNTLMAAQKIELPFYCPKNKKETKTK